VSQGNGRPIIDMHHHFIPQKVFNRLKEMAGGKTRLVTADVSITLNPDLPDATRHLAAMDYAGVTTSVLGNSGLNFMGMEICGAINDGMAETAREYPGRFIGSAHVAVDAGAPEEIERCLRELELPLISLPTSQNDVNLDDPRMDPIWEAAQRLHMPIMLHPNLLPKGASTDYGMERSISRPTDTTLAATRIMMGVFDRYPELVFILPHCGGTLGWLKGRVAMFYDHPSVQRPSHLVGYGLTASQQQQYGLDQLYEERFRKFYVDTAGTAAWNQAVKMTAEVFGVDRMTFGSDYPLESKTPEEMKEILSAIYHIGLSDAEIRSVESENALKLIAMAK
jgi:predicted TIM-barrel fold metal-dependent hydrolase